MDGQKRLAFKSLISTHRFAILKFSQSPLSLYVIFSWIELENSSINTEKDKFETRIFLRNTILKNIGHVH